MNTLESDHLEEYTIDMGTGAKEATYCLLEEASAAVFLRDEDGMGSFNS